MLQHSFREVIKQWGRMCNKHSCDNRDECKQILPLCPLVAKHSGYPCDDAVTDLTQESVAQVEEIVMQWAAENPEPVYPTWAKWLDTLGVLEDGVNAVKLKPKVLDPIPTDIAQKLGLEPKEG